MSNNEDEISMNEQIEFEGVDESILPTISYNGDDTPSNNRKKYGMYDERRDITIPVGKDKKITYSSGAKYNIVTEIITWKQVVALGLLIALGMLSSWKMWDSLVKIFAFF